MSTATTSYEILVVFPGSLKPSDLKKSLEKLEGDVGKLGKIANKIIWESKTLAYKIGRETQGTYFICVVEADPAKIVDFENFLRLDPGIIRYLIYKTPKTHVWTEYVPEDLEHDYTKLDRDLFVEEEKIKKKIPVMRRAPAVRSVEKAETAPTPKVKLAPVTKSEVKPVEKKSASKEEVGKKLDSIIEDLGEA